MGWLSKKGKHPSTGPPTYQIIKVPNANHMSAMKTSLTIIPMCPWERFSLYKSLPRLVLCYKKGLGHLAAPYLLSLLVTRYKLSYHKTICYLQFQCLQRIPYWKPLVISFCSSLGLTLLLIERTMIDPLHLWFIKTLFWRRCRGVKRLWWVELGKETFI